MRRRRSGKQKPKNRKQTDQIMSTVRTVGVQGSFAFKKEGKNMCALASGFVHLHILCKSVLSIEKRAKSLDNNKQKKSSWSLSVNGKKR